MMGDFSKRVYRIVACIPPGKVASYGTVARLMGSPRSARYVGFALKREPAPELNLGELPYHRVVFKDGSLCNDFIFGGPGVQRERLQDEGVAFADNNHVDMAACEWDGCGYSAINEEAENGTQPLAHQPLAPPPDFNWSAELGEL